MKKFLWITIVIIIIILGCFIGYKYFFVFGDGVKTGYLNYAVRKGDVFKTYEGKLIQEGIRSRTAGSVQSYEFEFSVISKRIYDTLKLHSGKIFDLHYKEYHGIVP